VLENWYEKRNNQKVFNMQATTHSGIPSYTRELYYMILNVNCNISCYPERFVYTYISNNDIEWLINIEKIDMIFRYLWLDEYSL